MKLSFALLTAIGVAGVTQFATAADVTGTVTLSGTPPAAIPIAPLNNDPVCGKMHSDKVFTEFYVVGANKELADTIVMLKGESLKPASAAASAAPVVLDQKGCLYVPQIVAIQTGQKLLVKNSDPVTVPMHNVHINPTAGPNSSEYSTKISQPQMTGAADLTYNFSAPENFMKFQCDVHPWMFAWVTVVDNPYYAVTGKDGKFTIKNVPPGKYKIVALHRKASPTGMEKEIEVKDSGATADFTLEAK